MSKAAQLAQKSKFYIEGAGTTPVNITAISKAFRAEITATHAFSKGDVVTLASVGGMVELNGLTAIVIDVTGTTKFCVNVDSRTFTTYTSGGTATGFAWTQINEIRGIKPSGASASKSDVSDLNSDAKEYLTGLVDNGTFSSEYFEKVDDPGQQSVLQSFTDQTVKSYKVALTGGSVRNFSACVLKFGAIPDLAVDGVQTASAEWQISGAVARS